MTLKIDQVYAMPTLVFIKDGKIQQRSEGAMLAPKIKDLTEHIFFDGVPSPSLHAADTLWCCAILFAAMRYSLLLCDTLCCYAAALQVRHLHY